MTTGLLSATSYTDQVRSGGLVWANIGNASLGPPYATSGLYGFGSFSDWLRGNAFTPTTPVPTSAPLLQATVTVRHRMSGGTYPVLFANLEVYVSGVLKQFLIVNTTLPTAFTDYTYSLDLAGIGLTPALLNAGALDVRIAYESAALPTGTSDPTNPSDPAYNPGLLYDKSTLSSSPPAPDDVPLTLGGFTYAAAGFYENGDQLWHSFVGGIDRPYVESPPSSPFQQSVKPALKAEDSDNLYYTRSGGTSAPTTQFGPFDCPSPTAYAPGVGRIYATITAPAGVGFTLFALGGATGPPVGYMGTGSPVRYVVPIPFAVADASTDVLMVLQPSTTMIGTITVDRVSLLAPDPAPTPSSVDVEYLALEVVYQGSNPVSGNLIPPVLVHLPPQGLTVL